jgi:hypothetical protein
MRRSHCIGLAAIIGMAMLAALSLRSADRPVLARADTTGLLKQMALQRATQMGDAAPTAVSYVASTRLAAVKAVSGAILTAETDRPVYVIEEDGDFVDSMAFQPPGTPAPTGTHLTLVVDATTLEVLDMGLTTTAPPLSKLGAVSPL